MASKDRKDLSPMDIVAVLTTALQQQQRTITELQTQVQRRKSEMKIVGVAMPKAQRK